MLVPRLHTRLNRAHLGVDLVDLLIHIGIVLHLEHEVVVIQGVAVHCALTQDEETHKGIVLQLAHRDNDQLASVLV